MKGFALHKCLESIWHLVVATISKHLGAKKISPAAAELQNTRGSCVGSKQRRNAQVYSYTERCSVQEVTLSPHRFLAMKWPLWEQSGMLGLKDVNQNKSTFSLILYLNSPMSLFLWYCITLPSWSFTYMRSRYAEQSFSSSTIMHTPERIRL